MKVKDLMKILAACDPKSEVILQKDGEGNGYSPLAGADPDAIYVSDSTWSGDVYSADWNGSIGNSPAAHHDSPRRPRHHPRRGQDAG